MQRTVEFFDTTLRDGAQQLGVNFSVADKIKVSQILKSFGIDLIEGGWPGAIPKDTEFFSKSSVDLVAFGATCKPELAAKDDLQLNALIDSNAKTICLVAKSDLRHVQEALKTTAEENLNMIERSVKFVLNQQRTCYIDAEHYFDGFDYNKDYAISVVAKAFESGAKCVILCDTNGGCLPSKIKQIVEVTFEELETKHNLKIGKNSNEPKFLGIHAHNDTGCAVANSIAAFESGVSHIQGTINEYGERTGNANLLTVIANLQLKCGVQTGVNLEKAFNLAHNIAEIANINIQTRQPYVGDIAFAHKAGLHASAIKVEESLYQHIDPKLVGNEMSMIISEMAGRSSIELKSVQLGYELNSKVIQELTDEIKEKEKLGYAFDSADASFELMLLQKTNNLPNFFEIESWRAISECGLAGKDEFSEATVKLTAKGERKVITGEGNGPVNALDAALRDSLKDIYPQINNFELTDYRVRLLDTSHGTDSITRVLITCYDRELNKTWTTIGVGGNIIESSWEALTDCYIFGLVLNKAN